MRIFYEEWNKVLSHQPAADDLVLNEKLLLMTIHQPVADEFIGQISCLSVLAIIQKLSQK